MGLRDLVAELFEENGLTPASGTADHFDGYMLEQSLADSLIVRCGLGTAAATPWRLENTELDVCEEILLDAGFRVKRVSASRGGYLVVMED